MSSFAQCRRINARGYDLEVVPEQDYKSTEFKLGSFRRPHMRAFHYAWFGFFAAKVAWYSASEVLPFVTAGFVPSNSELRNSTIINLVALALTRLAVGPICDVYGPRLPFVAMLCLGSIPVALVGAVNSLTGLYLQQFFVGIIGGTLVSGEFWASRMFAKEVVGTANALVAGWGDLGAGTCQVLFEAR
jgi:MFS transporter, NNP family, nitrate/nitrite transporter